MYEHLRWPGVLRQRCGELVCAGRGLRGQAAAASAVHGICRCGLQRHYRWLPPCSGLLSTAALFEPSRGPIPMQNRKSRPVPASQLFLNMAWQRLALLLIAASAWATCLAPPAALAQPAPAPALAVPEQCYRIHSYDFNLEMPKLMGLACSDNMAIKCDARCRTALRRVSPFRCLLRAAHQCLPARLPAAPACRCLPATRCLPLPATNCCLYQKLQRD